jgi:NAD(P)-dependent dehydrogenase (short-subunit alcohol dehydrogenase family)
MVDADATELAAASAAVRQAVAAATATGSGQQRIRAECVDVADAGAVERLAQQVFATDRTVHVLMNNAGTGLGGGPFTDLETVQHVVNVNLYGPIHGCLSFVPRMQEAGEAGIIVNTGSKQDITMPPGNLTYNMSKAALECYTEGLEHDLMKARTEVNGRLRAVLLVPGWVNTTIALKAARAKAVQQGEEGEPCGAAESSVGFHEGRPHQVIRYLIDQVDQQHDRFYVICPDSDVDRDTDNLRMTWTMQDITHYRPPLSRWHPDSADQFAAFMEANRQPKK